MASIHDCPHCRCETPQQIAARMERERVAREREFVREHAILTDEDLAWVRSQLQARHASA